MGTMIGNVLVTPLIACLFVALAWRQRLKPVWPVMGIAILVLLFINLKADFHAFAPYDGLFNLGYRHKDGLIRFGFSTETLFTANAWSHIAAQWPLVLAQWVLTALPLLWLIKMSKAKAPD
jgi:hypothetical protein